MSCDNLREAIIFRFICSVIKVTLLRFSLESIPSLLFRRVYKPHHRLRPRRRLSLKRIVLFQINLSTLAWYTILYPWRLSWREKTRLMMMIRGTKKEQEMQTVDTSLVYHLSAVCLHRRLQGMHSPFFFLRRVKSSGDVRSVLHNVCVLIDLAIKGSRAC